MEEISSPHDTTENAQSVPPKPFPHPPSVNHGDEGLNRWVIGILAGLAGSLLGAVVSLYTFSTELDVGNKHHEIALSRELIKEFNRELLNAREIRMAIERCETLYKPWGGSFDNDAINSYLGFFEELGFYLKRNVLSLDVIDHNFGAYIIEAYEYREIKRYIQDMRVNAKQAEVFKDFELLALRIESDPRLKDEVVLARDGCLKGKPATNVPKS